VPVAVPSATSGAALDRAALERVLARAAALQAAHPDGSDGTSEERLLEIAREVGLDPALVRVALAEERAGTPVPADGGWSARLAGPAWSSAQRTVPGRAAETLAALERWMLKEERLAVQRRWSDRLTFEPRESLATALDRNLGLSGRTFDLARAGMVAASVATAGEGQVVVRLDADQREGRRRTVIGAVAAGLAAGAVSLVWAMLMLFVVGVPSSVAGAVVALGLLPLLAGGLIARAILRGFGRARARVQLALERLLDKLEHEGLPTTTPSLLERLERAVR
jgi:hypothetical protein